MKLIEYNVFRRDTRNASGKAKYDASDVLASMGFERMYEPSSKRPIRVAQQAAHVLSVPRDAIVAVQYPGNKAPFYQMLKRRGVRTIALVHDIESLRENSALKRDSDTLCMFDCLIVHNAAMAAAVRNLGYDGGVFELGLFDYLSARDCVNEARDRNVVSFAGNFKKAAFVNKLNQLVSPRFDLYGAPEPTAALEASNVTYRGSYPSEEIASNVSGGWGLVWDGDSVETCAGALGNYLRYNCPHKASMYVVAERPLVVWTKSAIAPIVRSEGIGIAIESLEDLGKAISAVNASEYAEMLENVRRVRAELVSGAHLRKAMGDALESLGWCNGGA